MLMQLQQFWLSLMNNGIRPGHTEHESLYISRANAFSAILLVLSLPLAIYFAIASTALVVSLLANLLLVLVAVVLLLIKFGKPTIGRFMLCTGSALVFSATYLCINYNGNAQMLAHAHYLLGFGSVLLPLILFDRRERRYTVFAILFNMLLFSAAGFLKPLQLITAYNIDSPLLMLCYGIFCIALGGFYLAQLMDGGPAPVPAANEPGHTALGQAVEALQNELYQAHEELRQKEQKKNKIADEYKEMVEAFEEVNRRNLESAVKLVEREKEMIQQNQRLSEYAEELNSLNGQLTKTNEKLLENEKELKYKNGLLNETIDAWKQLNAQREQILAKLSQSKKELQEKSSQLEALYRKVTDSINYAERIQKAMLPTEAEFNSILPESFVLFRPRDIVSGDFYWLAQHGNTTILAVADCTGHGVPGAFMSTMGLSLLNEIVHTEGITQPDKILYALNKRVWKLLRQNEGKNHDGMEIGICCLTREGDTTHLQFAGAAISLRYTDTHEGVREIAGDKLTIGQKWKKGLLTTQESPFKLHSLQLPANTYYYLASDGYKDQFGGEEKRKFSNKRLESLLNDGQGQPAAAQKELLEQALTQWQGSEKQTDDILLIGFRA